jgi:hypothetical protein
MGISKKSKAVRADGKGGFRENVKKEYRKVEDMASPLKGTDKLVDIDKKDPPFVKAGISIANAPSKVGSFLGKTGAKAIAVSSLPAIIAKNFVKWGMSPSEPKKGTKN